MAKALSTIAVTSVFLFLCMNPGNAETIPDKLTIRQALDMAFSINPTLRESTRSLNDLKVRYGLAKIETSLTASAEAKRVDGTGGGDTNIMASGNWERNDPSGASTSATVTPIGIGLDRGSVSIQHRIPLRKGKDKNSQKYNDILDADSSLRIQEKQNYLTTQATVISVIQSYLSAVLAREEITVQESALKTAEEAAVSARKRAEEGLIADIEVSRAEISLAQTTNELNTRIQSSRGAVDNLLKTIGQGIGQNPELVDAVPEVNEQLPNLAAAVETALENRCELSIYDQRIADRNRKQRLTNDQLTPSLDAVAGFSSVNDRSGVLGRSIFDQNSLTVGLEYTITLDKRLITAEKELGERDLALFTDLRAYEMEKIAAEVRDSYRSVEQARNSLNILSQNLATAQENLRLAQRMVDEGLSSNREVLDAQGSLSSIQSGILSAKVNLYMANLNLKLSMGEDLTKMVMQ